MAGTYNARGTAHLYFGNHQEAIDDYTQAITLEPDNPSRWRRRSHTYFVAPTPQPQLAVEDATRAIELNPDHHTGYGHRAIALTQLPDPD